MYCLWSELANSRSRYGWELAEEEIKDRFRDRLEKWERKLIMHQVYFTWQRIPLVHLIDQRVNHNLIFPL